MFYGVCHARNRIIAAFIMCLMALLAVMSVVSRYDLRDHKWTFMYFLDLPNSYEVRHKTKHIVSHSWQTGTQNLLVDVAESYLKSLHGGKSISSRKFYQILHYNEEANNNANVDNTVIKSTCAYQNCYFTNNTTLYRNSSAVIFALSHGKVPIKHVLPAKVPGQVWIFYDREPPILNSKFFYRHHSWNNVMNWSMSYRLDSDIVFPYGVLRSRTPEEIPVKDYSAIYRKKTKFAFWLVSNCDKMVFSGRNEYVNELKKYIPVDIYGKCGTKVKGDVTHLFSEYKFYLSFENTFCKGYVTEKFFLRLSEDVLLVVRGGAEYDQLFPSETFINADNFINAASLAQHLLQIGNSEQLYTDYLRSKDKYAFNGTLNWQCQMCTKLNNQERYQRLYENVVSFWNHKVCWKPNDVPISWTRYYVIMTSFILVLVLFQCFWFKHRGINGRRIIGAFQAFYKAKPRI